MAKRLTVLIPVLILLLAIPASVGCSTAENQDSETTPELLLDMGNGHTEWVPIVKGYSIEDTLSATLGSRIAFGDVDNERRVLSVDNVKNITIGTGNYTQDCYWRIYSWNSVEWEFLTSDVSERYISTYLALAYYPNDLTTPVSNPEYRGVWTSYRGDSSSSGISTSTGPSRVATPLEWYNSYAGAVDASILYADGMIYHTVAGKYGAVGMDSLAKICCLDPVNQEVLWSRTYSSSSNIEITTPVIIGNMILVSSGNWHIYCLDRFTGEPLFELMPNDSTGDMCKGSKITTYIKRMDDGSVTNDRIHSNAGITNMVYDSGALYFGTSDGLLRCFSIDRENGFKEIWNFKPDNSYRGCFYYYPPVVSDFEGKKYVMIGNYGGGLICVDGTSGQEVWHQTVTDTEDRKVGQVSSIVTCSNGQALVCYSGGEMSSTGGGIMLIDITNGSILWKQDIRCGKPVAYQDRFYCYITARTNQKIKDRTTGQEIDLVNGYYSLWINDGSVQWSYPTDALSIGGVTYCDGKLYSMDYSPGTEGVTGGQVWCLDSDTGSVVWKVKVSPYNGNAYSMCAPTVVDGKVIVGNDYGAIYILSENSYDQNGRTANINYESVGLAHWSWIATFALVGIALVVSVWRYRS